MEKGDETEKYPSETDLSVVSNVSNVSNVSKKRPTIPTIPTKLTTDKLFLGLGFGLKDRILGFIYSKGESTYKQISTGLNEDYDSIIQTMKRSQDFFNECGSDGKSKLFNLHPKGQTYVKNSISEYKSQQKNFQESIKREKDNESDKEKLLRSIQEVFDVVKPERDGNILRFDFQEIAEMDPNLSEIILERPEECCELIASRFEDLEDFIISFKNLSRVDTFSIEEIRAKHFGRLISVEARCVSLSSVRGSVISSRYECPSCGTLISKQHFDDILKEPSRCSCGRRGGFKTIGQDVEDTSGVVIEDIQERTENPNTQRLKCRIKGYLTRQDKISIFTPGNEVRIIGILRQVKSYNKGILTTNLGFLLDVLEVELFEPEVDLSKFTDEDIQEVKDMAGMIDIEGLEHITESFAPEVYGYDKIKQALMLQISSKRNDPKIKTIRNKPNILLIGDPGTAKSVLGNFVISITPGSRKATGGGSSAVGITASVVKEEESIGGFRVEPGAMVLAKELLFLDELNNLPDDDKPKLQEGMSEQVVSINKANLHVSLKVLAGILACANPIKGHFVPGNISEQFNIPSPILNRFDLIFVMKDYSDPVRDNKIAERMIQREQNQITSRYSKEQLRKFFVFVRNQPEPTMSEKIVDRLKIIYINSRKDNNPSEVMINARFMEALNRLIKSSAKIRMSKIVEEKDIIRSLAVLNKSHFQIKEYKHFNFEEQLKNYKLNEQGMEILKP